MELMITQDHINVVADGTADWQKLARRLPLHKDPSKLRQILKEIETDCKEDPWLCCSGVLERWLQSNPDGATMSNLIVTLRKMGNEQLARTLKDTFEDGKQENSSPDSKTGTCRQLSTENMTINTSEKIESHKRKHDDACLNKSSSAELERQNNWERSDSSVQKESSELTEQSMKEPWELHGYQKELAQPALEGLNTLVCAPTNSGKTYVAIELAKHLLEQSANKKVVFFAMTLALVDQQHKRLTKHLDQFGCEKVTGEIKVLKKMPLKMIIENCRIIVMTPQLMCDAFEQSKVDEVDISEFCLFVFDECHHCIKRKTYNKIMRYYHKKKEGGVHVPQILGLTASVGVGDASLKYLEEGKQQALKHIINLCGNLDIQKLKTVTDPVNVAELKKRVPFKHQELVKVGKRNMDAEFPTALGAIMNQIEALLVEHAKSESSSIADLFTKGKVKDHGSFHYEQWLKEILDIVATYAVVENRAIFLAFCSYLKKLNRALMLYTDALATNAFDFLQEFCEKQTLEISSEEKRLKSIIEGHLPILKQHIDKDVNPKLAGLKNLLIDAFKSNADSRGMVFARTRALAEALKNWLEEQQELDAYGLCPSVLIGKERKPGSRGMTGKEQTFILDMLRKGNCKILLATSVAQEGLDIPELDLIVRYDQVGSEISMIQERGRVRKEGGSAKLLTEGGSQIIHRERLNLAKEQLMYSAIQDIQYKSDDWFMGEVEVAQKIDIEVAKVEAQKNEEKYRQLLASPIYEIRCFSCNQFVCESTALRTNAGNQHIVIDKTIYDRMNVEKHHDEGLFVSAGFTKMSKIHCYCNINWGIEIEVDGCVFPVLKIKEQVFVLVNKETGVKRRIPNKWDKVPFLILPNDKEG